MLYFNSNNFSIEVDNENTQKSIDGVIKLAPIRLIINSNYIGTLDSPTYIPSFIYGVGEKILCKNTIYFNKEINFYNYKQFFMALDELKSSQYINMLEETFDDFFLRTVRNSTDVFFSWEIIDDPFFSYPNSWKNKKYYEIIPICDLYVVQNQFINWFNNLNKN